MSAREEIMKAADRLFGEVGFEAATTREIAELSGVNKALIHYHFKSKDSLYGSVLDDYYARLDETLQDALAKEGTLRDRMLSVVDAYVDFLAHNLNFSRIVQRESSGGAHLDRVRAHLMPMFETGRKLLEETFPATRSGEFAAHQLLTSFYGMIVSYFTYSGVLEHLIGRDPLSQKELEARKAHLHKMFDIMLSAMQEEEGSRRNLKNKAIHKKSK
ncbi:MAG: TetR/AcrR family transcriptional regulator [bacterium]